MAAPLTEKILRALVRTRGFESQHVEVDGCAIHYFEKTHGPDRPTIVLVHGISAAAVHYEKILVPLYDAGFNIIVPDLPAHGFSAAPGGTLTADRLYDYFCGFLENAAPKRFHLIGNSLGGGLSLRYALNHQDRLLSLIAISPAGGFESPEEWDRFRSSMLLNTRAEAREFLSRIYARAPWYAGVLAGAVLEGFLRPGIRDLLTTTTFADFEESNGVSTLKTPMLLIWGKEERVFPAKNLGWFRSNLPAHAVIDHSDGIGHCPQLDAAAWLFERLDRYFKSL